LKIQRPDVPPLGGWNYTAPQTGVRIEGNDPSHLVANVRKHLRGNGIKPPEGLAEIVEHDICQRELVPCTKQDRARVWTTVKSGTDALLAAVKSFAATGESPKVDQQEAERRASICASCPLNVPLDTGCQECKAKGRNFLRLLRAAARTLGSALGLHTRQDARLKQCADCRCELRLKVHVRFSALPPPPANLRSRVPSKCWQLEDPRL
jgi:hypothetical protein